MNKEQALQNLYNAARQAKLTADEHAVVVQSAQLLAEALKSKEEKKEAKK